jgi:hypothetical protein
MQPILIAGVALVNLALILYTVFIILFRRKGILSTGVLVWLISAVLSNIASSIFMILGSSTGGLSLHSYVGYSALFVMFLCLAFVLVEVFNAGIGTEVSKKLRLWVSLGYFYWIAAYIANGLIIAMGHGAMG